ncbi:hypothetical protein [Shewanella maritima]|uniref:hypothetical protein n=1 Tax=Shewanella maritima TaxID=2520507 RepID=UPI0037364356
MFHTNNPIIKHKAGLRNLAEELELEISTIHKNYKESVKFEAETLKLVSESRHLDKKRLENG